MARAVAVKPQSKPYANQRGSDQHGCIPFCTLVNCHYTYVFLNCKYFFTQAINYFRVSTIRYYLVVLAIPLWFGTPHATRAFLYIRAVGRVSVAVQARSHLRLHVPKPRSYAIFDPPPFVFVSVLILLPIISKLTVVKKGIYLTLTNTTQPKIQK